MPWFKKSFLEPLAISMSGVKLGDRVLVVGGGDVRMLTGVALKTGLTGRTCVVDENDERAKAAVAAAESEGALVEGFTAPWTSMPFNDKVFDLVILREVLPALTESMRANTLREVLRVLRPGGRCLVVEQARGGLAGLFNRTPVDPSYVSGGGAPRALEAQGFRAVRTLAAREGLVFVEAVRVNA